VMSGIVVFGGFLVVTGGMLEVFWCLPVVFSSFLRHGISLHGIR